MNEKRFPAEWEKHDAVWTAWPSAAELWEDDLDPARGEVADLCHAIAMPDPEDDSVAGERIELLVRGDEAEASAREELEDLIACDRARIHQAPIGDIWLRDTGPVFLRTGSGLVAQRFGFNGWGGKYLLADDDRISGIVAAAAGISDQVSPFILEGGAIDGDGAGTILTTRQCVLNDNRNPGMTEEKFEKLLAETLGTRKVIWLDDGLLNDHTDGHVDNIARFVAPGRVVCMAPAGKKDPNREALLAIRKVLSMATDAAGRPLEVIDIPSAGFVANDDGEPVPASHMNFYIANHSLVIPVYAQTDEQERYMEEAVELLGAACDREHVYAISANHLLTGGGSFHCITQQQPA